MQIADDLIPGLAGFPSRGNDKLDFALDYVE
jgi:hypothetical protein